MRESSELAKPNGTTQIGDNVDTDGGDYIAGDKNTVDVERAENVVIDAKGPSQTTFNIGTLSIPRHIIAPVIAGGGLFALAITGLLVANYVRVLTITRPTVTPGPAMMSGALNVAVAQFSSQDSKRTQIESADGMRYSSMLFASLQEELKTSPNVQIWHDSLDNAVKGVKIGVIAGANEDERRKSAADVAKRIGADMVIYGVLSQSDEYTTLKPEFYVAESNELLRHSPEAADILGGRRLGPPIDISLPFTRSSTGVLLEYDIAARTRLVRGIVRDLVGLHAEALTDFQHVQAAWTARGKPGEETLSYFLGREALFLTRDKNQTQAIAAFGTLTAAISFAEQQFQNAIKQEPTYAQGWWGLGTALLKKAEPIVGDENNLSGSAVYTQALLELDTAITHYDKALSLVNADERPVLYSKIETSKANALRLKSLDAFFREDDAASIELSKEARALLGGALRRLGNDPAQARAIAAAQHIHAVVLINDAVRYQFALDADSATRALSEAKSLLDACLAHRGEDRTLQDFQVNNCQSALAVVGNMESKK